MALFLLLTLVALLVGAIMFIYALVAHEHGLAKTVTVAALAWAAIYFGALLIFSATSEEKVLAMHERKPFCGFYLDCHLGVSVENVEKTKTLGDGPRQRTAGGIYYVVTVKVSSDAKAATLSLSEPETVIVDDHGQKYERALEAENQLASAKGKPVSFTQEVGPQGGFFTQDLVFDLPQNVKNPRLLLNEGDRIERFIELFVIGDEDSLLHKKTELGLDL